MSADKKTNQSVFEASNHDRSLILGRFLTGSRAYGLHNEGSDWDYRSIHVDPLWKIASGLYGFESKTRNMPGEDHQSYEIGHFAGMLLKSSPTALELLYLPCEFAEFEQMMGERTIETDLPSKMDCILLHLWDFREEFLRTERFETSCFGIATSDSKKALKTAKAFSEAPDLSAPLNEDELETFKRALKGQATAFRVLAMLTEVRRGETLIVDRRLVDQSTQGSASHLRNIREAFRATNEVTFDFATSTLQSFGEELEVFEGAVRELSELPKRSAEETDSLRERLAFQIFRIRERLAL